MNHVFVVQHQHTLPGGEHDIKMIGVYSSRSDAEEAVARLSTRPGFKASSKIVDLSNSCEEDGFFFDQCQIDEDNWCEGFVTMIGGEVAEETTDT